MGRLTISRGTGSPFSQAFTNFFAFSYILKKRAGFFFSCSNSVPSIFSGRYGYSLGIWKSFSPAIFSHSFSWSRVRFHSLALSAGLDRGAVVP